LKEPNLGGTSTLLLHILLRSGIITMPDFFASGDGRPESKIFTTLGELPGYIDRSQPPTKRQPWRAISDVGFVRNVELVLPEELYEVMWRRAEENLTPITYAKVIMKLEDVLNGDFFTEYIKKGKLIIRHRFSMDPPIGSPFLSIRDLHEYHLVRKQFLKVLFYCC
jgi:hypothetical protein